MFLAAWPKKSMQSHENERLAIKSGQARSGPVKPSQSDLLSLSHPVSPRGPDSAKGPKLLLLLELRHGIVCLIMGKRTCHHRFLALVLMAGWLAVPWTVRADDGIQTYTVPKERPAPVQPATAPPGMDAAMPASDIPVNSAPVRWTTPSTWQELAPTSIRIGNFVVRGQDGAKAEAAIFSFPGPVGTELDNVNRWRNELKLPPVEQDKITSEPVTIDSLEGKLYEISGPSEHTVVASLSRNGATWFIKMRGDKDVVTDAEPVFRDFLQSIRFNAAGSEAPTDASLKGAIASPRGDEPKWTPPANWTEKVPGPMIFKSYSAANGQGKTASVTISFFPGDVGGVFANVNRWRAQMGLPPVGQDKLDSVTQPLDTAGGKATLVDFTGTDTRTGQPGRLVAVMVPHGDNTWFYKLSGDGAVVEDQKGSFVKFVQTVRYP
jgi:hypothetical protein